MKASRLSSSTASPPEIVMSTRQTVMGSRVTSAAARSLHLSVRALTYRLARVQRLTGYDPCSPEQRYTLETAVLGARMLGWPDRPLPPRS